MVGKRNTIPKATRPSKKVKRGTNNEEGLDDSIQFLGESGPTPPAPAPPAPAPPAPAPPAGMTVTRQGEPAIT